MNLIIVDDDSLVTMSLKTILSASPQIQIVACGYSGTDAISLYQEYQPDILLMDIRMEGLTGLDASRQILELYPDAKILLLTTFSDDAYIMDALRIGVKGYILKQDFDAILPALVAVNQGQNVFGSTVAQKIPDLMKSSNPEPLTLGGISSKEEQVISLVAKGLSNREIAEALFLSEGTVRNYISTILEKLQLRDRTQLAVFYLSR